MAKGLETLRNLTRSFNTLFPLRRVQQLRDSLSGLSGASWHYKKQNMTQAQALTNALWSAIHCPDHMAEAFSQLAQEISQGMTESQIERCKAVALNMEEPA